MVSDECAFVESELSDSGLDASVTKHEDPARMVDVFTVKVDIPAENETVASQFTISAETRMQLDDVSQELVSMASRVHRQVEDRYTEYVHWGENGVMFDWRGDYEASCVMCDESVSASDLEEMDTPVMRSEATVPHSMSPDYRDIDTLKIKFAMLALLQSKCEQRRAHRKI